MADPMQTSDLDTRKTFEELMGVKRPYLERTAKAREDVVGAEADIARATQAQAEAKASAAVAPTKQYVSDVQAAQQAYQQKKEAEPIPAFVPTRDNAEDLAKLFSFIGVAGTFLGRGGGKQAAMGAMAGMTGMMQGWRQGRMDLYNQEKAKFEKDFARVQKMHQDLAKDLETAVKTAATNKELGIRLAEEAAVKAGSDIVAAKVRQGNLVSAYETSKEMLSAVDKALGQVERLKEADIRGQAQIAAAQARAGAVKPTKPDIWVMPDGAFIDASKQPGGVPPAGARRPSAVEAAARAEGRLSAADEARERKAAELSPPERKEYRGLKNLSDEIQLLADTFKPEYANFVFDKAGDITAKFQARIANDPGMAEWWRRYENVALPERHSIFGATLTGGEKDSWRKASIGAGNTTEEVLSWIADKERVMGKKIDLLLKPVPARGQPKPVSAVPPSSVVIKLD